MTFYVIEHLDKQVYKWCLIEYTHISKIVGKRNLIFTNIKRKNKNLEKLGKVYKKRFSELMQTKKINPTQVCVLDPEAKEILKTKDKKFNYLIFGGILGDYPPRKRTKKELTNFIQGETRNIGKKQFSTDNAVYVTHQILNGKRFQDMKFKNHIEIKKGKYESIILPFLYPIVNNQPLMSPRLLKFLKRKRGF